MQDDPRLTVIHEDARSALPRMSGKYDAILLDVFNSHYSIPFHMTTRETAELLRGKLADDGVVILNILSGIEGREGRFLRAEYATYKSVFEQVVIYPVTNPLDGSIWQNVILVAMKSDGKADFPCEDPKYRGYLSHLWPKPVVEDILPLTDDFAPVDAYLH